MWIYYLATALAQTDAVCDSGFVESAIVEFTQLPDHTTIILWLFSVGIAVVLTGLIREQVHSRERFELEQKITLANHRAAMAQYELSEFKQSLDIVFTEERLKNLMKLCHPDKHKQSAISHETMKWLIIFYKAKKEQSSGK